jgi:hypothetical protein
MRHLPALILTLLSALAFAQSIESAGPPLTGVRAAGQGTYKFWGLQIYTARLWVSPGFEPERFDALPLALELEYKRDFTAQDIARRSIDEMKRQGPLTAQQAAQWLKALQSALPDVKAGDRLMGLYRPGRGAEFQLAGRTVGEVNDPAFARLFFGIWLSSATSDPDLRQALVSQKTAP